MSHILYQNTEIFEENFLILRNTPYICYIYHFKRKYMAKIKVQNTEVSVITYDEKDYISLTDMVRNIEISVIMPPSTN